MTLNVNNPAAINETLGNRTHHSCKPVICIDTGEVFASVTDAAEAIGVSVFAVSSCCTGKTRPVKGKHFCHVSKTSENLDVLTAVIRAQNAKMAELEADAAIGRVIREEQEAKRKAEEAHLKAIDDAKADLIKAKNKFERRARMVERKENEYQHAIDRYTEAEREVHEAELKLMQLEGITKTEDEEK